MILMRKYNLLVIIEGDVNDVVSFKNLVTNSAGYFDASSFFKNFVDSSDVTLPAELNYGDYDFSTPDDLILEDGSSVGFESFWNQSLNGSDSGDRRGLFQLRFAVDAISIFQSVWYSVSIRYPGITICISFSDYDDCFEGNLLFINGKIFRSVTQEGARDKMGYNVFLNSKNQWAYVRPFEQRAKGLEPRLVEEKYILPLKDQLSLVEDTIDFCNNIPIETFPSWFSNEDNYYVPRPNTVYYPYPVKISEPDPNDFDFF